MSKRRLIDLPDETVFYVRNWRGYGLVTRENNEKVVYIGIDLNHPKEGYLRKLTGPALDDYWLDCRIVKLNNRKCRYNVLDVTERLIRWIKEWFEVNGKGCNAVLGISGDKDSTVAAALCVKALGKERVIGVLLSNGEESDIADAYEICDILGIRSYYMNIEEKVEAAYELMLWIGLEITEQVREETPLRERNECIRSVCRSQNGRMVNTCNLSEDYIGCFTIGGDGDGDFAPLADITATEVIQIGHYLGLPSHLVDKMSAGDLCGKTDEEKYEFSYAVLDDYIRTGKCDSSYIKSCIDERHRNNGFKMQTMPKFKINGDYNI